MLRTIWARAGDARNAACVSWWARALAARVVARAAAARHAADPAHARAAVAAVAALDELVHAAPDAAREYTCILVLMQFHLLWITSVSAAPG